MEKTLFIISSTNDPAFNLAAEEVFMKKHKENILFFYINNSSIIVGKHQNTLAEINLQYLEENHIPVYRRLSGGGTVYHDNGNINYCLIENGEPGKLVDFVRATKPVVQALKNEGIDARHGKRNDLLVGHKKISGNACHVFKNRTMHHGTLLFNANLSHLTEALKVNQSHFNDKAVKSVRSEVINIGTINPKHKSPEDFLNAIGSELKRIYGAQESQFSDEDIKEIKKRMAEKYNTWEWNYGYSPTYEFSKRYRSNTYIYSSKIKVKKGIISRLVLKTNHPEKEKIEATAQNLAGVIHEKNKIKEVLAGFDKEVVQGVMGSLFQ